MNPTTLDAHAAGKTPRCHYKFDVSFFCAESAVHNGLWEMLDLWILWEIAQLPGLITLFQTKGSYGVHLKGSNEPI